MNLNEIIKATYHNNQCPNPAQLKAIKHIEGPLLIVAGPGSGKTKTLITRTLNLLLCHNVASENILLCTFTQKAARQLRDRVNADLKKCGADDIDIHGMTIGTIHSICQRIIDEYPNEAGTGLYHKTKGLGRGYVILDELQHTFFIMDHFDEIFGNPLGLDKRYLGLWKGFWDTIENSQEYFDKITEENVDVKKLIKSSEEIHSVLGKAMQAYRRLQVQEGKIDFAHMEWLAYDLLQNNPGAKREFHHRFEYIMVDEYQDTNYIQEQIIFTLANKDKNIAVVGDVDQSIYRFRGATTQNILKFPERVGQMKTTSINLGINYRSSQKIIDLYQSYRDEIDWHGCRYPLNVESDKTKEQNRPDYITTIKINEKNSQIEGNKVADLIVTLKDTGVIDDYNQVAILLYSVRPNYSGQYIEAISNLKDKGEEIEVYAPRARLFFERPEVMCLLAGFYTLNNVDLSEITGGYSSQETESIKDYLTRCIKEFRRRKGSPGHGEFQKKIKDISDQIKALKKTENKPVKTVLMYFYDILNTEFMGRWLDQELPARHLAQISKLLEVFSEYYGYEWIGGKNADQAWAKFFNSFLRVLVDGGLNEYEDEEQAFPSGAVQVMTFHQSKGLEFPVVIVGSLHAQVRSGKKVDDILSDYYHRDLAENRAYISEFDKRRLYYVAFSRAKDFLVLSGHRDLSDNIAKRRDHFKYVLGQCQEWDLVKKRKAYFRSPCEKGDKDLLKPIFGFTSHINAYERCPMQFKLQKLYGFVPKRNEQLWIGTVVHNTLKDIHDHMLKKKPGTLTNRLVKDYLEKNIASLARHGVTIPIPQTSGVNDPKKVVEESILRYVKENKKKLHHCRWAEKEILVDEKDYTLTGVIDLLIHDDTGKVELIDFKAGRKKNNLKYRGSYVDQIRLYCKQVEYKIGKIPDEANLYWITEPKGVNPRDPIAIDTELLEGTRARVDATAQKIIQEKFPKLRKKDENVCGICEFYERCRQ